MRCNQGMIELSWTQVLAWRMRRQHLDTPVTTSPVDIARRLGGVQAQVASAASLAIALRCTAGTGTAPDTASALWQDKTLMKTWAMRGTLHLLPAADAGAYLALCATIRSWEKPSWQKAFGAKTADLEAIAAAAADILSDGEPRSRTELTTAIVAETGSGHLAELLGSGWGTLLKPLAWWGVLCYGPPQGNQVTFTAPSQLPGWTGLPPVSEAARTVISAYLGAHGPATADMFDNWLSRKTSRKGELRGWFVAAADDLIKVRVDGREMFALAAHADELAGTRPNDDVRLLGAFDPYVLGAGTAQTEVVPAGHRQQVSRTAGWISPVVLYQGKVAGVWAETGGGPEVTPFTEIPAKPLAMAVERMRGLLRA